MGNSVPQIIQDVGFDFWWDSEKVWRLEVPTTQLSISELAWHFEYPFWDENDGKYNLRPMDVIKFPKEHAREYKRTLAADLRHPIDIMKNKKRWLILDGLHRLARAAIEGQNMVEVRIIPRNKIPFIIHDRASEVSSD